MDDEETDEIDDSDDVSGGLSPQKDRFPLFQPNVGNHMWKSALWLPATWSTTNLKPTQSFMKLGTGARNIAAPASELFSIPGITMGKEKVCSFFKRVYWEEGREGGDLKVAQV